ncbi:MAG: hypothetical protein RR911_04400 [Oscillospiraceae bacterium]
MISNLEIYKSIIICLEQKQLFITDALDITKQIEVQSKQEDFEIDSLLNQRQTKIERMKKCDLLINQKLKELQKHDKPQADHWKAIVSGKKCELSDEYEKLAFDTATSIKSIAKKTIKIEKNARENLQQQYEEAKEKLSEIRKNNPPTSGMFNV